MSWKLLHVAPEGTHHLRGGIPAYAHRFDEVLKFHDPGLAPVRLGAAAFHIHPDGQPAYAPRFLRTFGFYEGLATVVSPDGWHHIHASGSDAYASRFAWCGNFQGGLCTVREHHGYYYHITPQGEPAYAKRFRYAGDFRDGVGVVQAEDGLSTHIDPAGQPIHGRFFLDLDVFHKGFARARDEAGWMHVNIEGKAVYTQRFAAVEPFYNGQARVERFDGGLEIIDESGKTMAELRPARRSEFAALSSDMVGFWKTQTIAAAVALGVFEALPGSAPAIAETCGLHVNRTQRLLRALSELSLLHMKNGQFWPTARGEFLRAGHPFTLCSAAREYGHFFPRMWEALPEALRKNGAWSPADIFGEVAADASRRKTHHQMLQSYARHDYAHIPKALALRGDERLVDAGGGLGVLASSLSEHYPQLHVFLLDRPEVIEQASSNHSLNSRIETRAVNIFEPWNIQADAVLLARVLHDWNDSDALRILHRAREALPAGAKLFIVEMLLEEDGVSGSLCDLHLLMATGGQERTMHAYQALMHQSGFEFSELRRLPALPSIIVGFAR